MDKSICRLPPSSVESVLNKIELGKPHDFFYTVATNYASGHEDPFQKCIFVIGVGSNVKKRERATAAALAVGRTRNAGKRVTRCEKAAPRHLADARVRTARRRCRCRYWEQGKDHEASRANIGHGRRTYSLNQR